MANIDIGGLNKAALLAGLYNASHSQGLSAYGETAAIAARGGSAVMTTSEAADIIGQHGIRFDYLKGRVLKVDLGTDDLFAGLYDRDCGEGTAQRVVDALRASS